VRESAEAPRLRIDRYGGENAARYARERVDVLISPSTVTGAIWLIWLAAWWLGALKTAQTVAREAPSSQLSYSIFVWVGAALLFFNALQGGIFSRALYRASPIVAWIGVALVVLGLAYSVWARLHLGRMWSAVVTVKAEHRIVKSGPYTITRHPIYTGLLLALVGTVLVRDTVAALIGCVLIGTGLVLKVRREEAMLIEHFGDDYRVYQEQVPALIPRPWVRPRESA
jgi:protein-S-isoprenylcysteine O-methyltransferase Ste14